MKDRTLKVCGWLVRDGIAAVGCSSMGAGSMGGENYCGNLLWQSCLSLSFPSCYVMDTSRCGEWMACMAKNQKVYA